MRTRRLLILPLVALGLLLAGCGLGRSAVDCGGRDGRVCAVMYEVPGAKDLSTPYGPGTTVAVKTITPDAVTVRVKSDDARLVIGATPTTAGGLLVSLARVSEEGVLLLLSPAP
jgi:hypothetical protein